MEVHYTYNRFMIKLSVRGISSDWCEGVWRGGVDDYGQLPVRRESQGLANPCRHCLGLIEPGTTKLVLAYRPFEQKQAYAETGPIFLHSQPCSRYRASVLPSWFQFLCPAIVRGYGADHWIRYETNQVVAGSEISKTALDILSDSSVAYVHVRSKFNCFQCRIDREQGDAKTNPVPPEEA